MRHSANVWGMVVLASIAAATCCAATFNATEAGGEWTAPATWVENSGFPVDGDTALQSQPGMIALSANAAASHLSIRNGVVDLGTNTLTLSSRLDVGQDGPLNNGAQLIRSVGSRLAITNGNTFLSNGGILNLLGGDWLGNLYGYGNASACTVNQGGNVLYSGQVGIDNGLTYNLGANTLTANRLDVGQGGGTGNLVRAAGSVLNISQNIFVQRSGLEVRAGDSIVSLHCDNAATVTQVGDVAYTGTIEGINNHSVYNLGANHLTVSRLDLGHGGGTGFLTRTSGSLLSVQNLLMQRSALELRAGDAITGLLQVENGSVVTQMGSFSNATMFPNIYSGGAYRLGANSLTCGRLDIGNGGGTGMFTRAAGSVLSAANIYLQRSALEFHAGDTVAGELRVQTFSAVTQVGNVSNPGMFLNIYDGGAYHLGANSLSCGRLDIGYGGGTGIVTRAAGSLLTAANIYMQRSTLELHAGDSIPGELRVHAGSSVMQHGAVSNPSQYLNVYEDGTYAMGAHSLTVGRLDLGYGGGTGILTRAVGSVLTAANVFMQRSALELRAGDTIPGELRIHNGSTVTQVGTVNSPGLYLNVYEGSGYNLGASSLTAGRIDLGWGGGLGMLSRAAGSTITNSSYLLNNGVALQLGAGDVSSGDMNIYGSSSLSTAVGDATTTGWTLNGGWATDEFFQYTITFSDPNASGYMWGFRWLGDHVATLTDWVVAGGRLRLINNATSGTPAIAFDEFGDGYTYVGMMGTAAAPPTGPTLIVR